MTNQEELLNEIKVLSDSIRKKHLALKEGIIARNQYLEDTFKPIVDPLNKINDTIKQTSLSSQGEKIENYKQQAKELGTSDTRSSERDTESVTKSSDITEEEDDDEEIKTDIEEEGESDTNVASDSPTNISILSREIGEKGPLSRKYILKMLHGARQSSKYHVYGARLAKDGIRIGDSQLTVDDNDNIKIKGQTFKGTSGLFELIFESTPKKYSKSDLNKFKTICMLTNSHRKAYSPSTPIHRNKSEKYKNVIAKLFSKYRGLKRTGKGMSMKSVYNTNIIYYNDVNKLVDRMRLIYESIQAGHNGLDNEMVALTEELKGRGYIS